MMSKQEKKKIGGTLQIKKYIFKYWYAYTFAIICMIFSITLDMLSPQITKRIIDDVIVGGNTNILSKLLLGILYIGVGRCIFQYLKEFIFDAVSVRISADIRRNLFRHIQSLSVSFFEKTNTGELMSRVKDDVDNIWAALGFVGMLIIEVVIHTVTILVCMVGLNLKLSVFPMIAVPLLGTVAILMEKKLGSVYEEISEENAVLNTVAQENLAGVRTVKAFAREKFEIQKFLSRNKRYYELNMRQSKVFAKYNPYFQFISRLLLIMITMFGGFMVIRGEMTLGTLGAFLEYTNNIIWPMEMIGWLTNSMAFAAASSKKISKILEEEPVIIETESPVKLDKVEGNIEFRHVSFEMENKRILTDINFHLKAGKTVGIMGATGAGKSSLVNLLQRFYDVTDGEILLDHVNIKDLSLEQLRGSSSVVMQETFLFSDTVKENIKLGKRFSLEDKEIFHAVKNAHAKEFIERMDNRYDTVIGERGVGLSGGQKQRISIARALSKKAPILILDDSTSALDMETEQMIQDSLRELKDTTKIIIAHRISAVRNADEIIILENGIIAERGTHEELLGKNGLYCRTYEAQYANVEINR